MDFPANQPPMGPWAPWAPADWCSHGHGHADADAAWEYDWTRPVLVSVIH